MKPLQVTINKYQKLVTKKINIKKRINWGKRHLRVKKNRRRLLYIAGGFVIYSLSMGLIAQHTQADHTKYDLSQRLSAQHKAVQQLTGQLQTVEKLKASTDQQVQQKAADEANLQAQIDQLNQQLQAKAAAKAQSLAAATAQAATFTATTYAAPAPQAPVAVSGGCGDNEYAHYIYMHESGCNLNAVNGGGCRGIGQACPGGKLPCGADYACQNAYFSAYASKYGGWAGAYAFWTSHGWW